MREAIDRHEETVTSPSPSSRRSDPTLDDQHGYARSLTSFVDVEYLDANAEIRVYRYGGASSDVLRLIDASTPGLTITPTGTPVTTVRTLVWAEPLPSFGELRVDVVKTSGTSATAVYRVLNQYLAD